MCFLINRQIFVSELTSDFALLNVKSGVFSLKMFIFAKRCVSFVVKYRLLIYENTYILTLVCHGAVVDVRLFRGFPGTRACD